MRESEANQMAGESETEIRGDCFCIPIHKVFQKLRTRIFWKKDSESGIKSSRTGESGPEMGHGRGDLVTPKMGIGLVGGVSSDMDESKQIEGHDEVTGVQRGIVTFPEVLIVKICGFLTVEDFVRLTSTSKAFAVVRWDDFAWSIMTDEERLSQTTLCEGQLRLDLRNRVISNVTLLSQWLKNTSQVEQLVCLNENRCS